MVRIDDDVIFRRTSADEINALVIAFATHDGRQAAGPNAPLSLPPLPHIQVGRIQIEQRVDTSLADTAAIRAAYDDPPKLVGRNVVFIANLAPRKMRFGVSEGMILSAGSGGADLHLLDADPGATPGMPVK